MRRGAARWPVPWWPPPSSFLRGIASRRARLEKLSPERREALYPLILQRAAASAVEAVSEDEIDRINILQATYKAMRKAIADLAVVPGHVLVDGRSIPGLEFPQTALVAETI